MNPYGIETYRPTYKRRRVLLPMIAITALIPLAYVIFVMPQASQRRPDETAAAVVQRHEVAVHGFIAVCFVAFVVCAGLSVSMARRPRF